MFNRQVFEESTKNYDDSLAIYAATAAAFGSSPELELSVSAVESLKKQSLEILRLHDSGDIDLRDKELQLFQKAVPGVMQKLVDLQSAASDKARRLNTPA